MRITIVVPPFTKKDWPSLGAEHVANLARGAGHEAGVFYSCLLGSIPAAFADTPGAPGVFTPIYHPGLGVTGFADELITRLREDRFFAEAFRCPPGGESHTTVVKRYLRTIIQAREIARETVQGVLADGHPDVVGFSIASDLQKMPAAALAKSLRSAGFQGLIVAGGSALDEGMGLAYLTLFPEFDGVLRGEVEDTWADFLASSVQGWQGVESIPGAHALREGGVVSGPEPVYGSSFTSLPTPDYTEYLRQREVSEVAATPVVLLAETSRSCWWGESHRCTFCGVDSESRPYRHKDVAGAVRDLCDLYDRFRPDGVLLTDSIMPHSQVSEYLRLLSERHRDGRPWHLFYEVKSTLKRSTIAQLACAGVTEIQPGIESFSNHSLSLMNKGATALQQVNLLKWATAYGVQVNYPLLVGTPGETADDLVAVRETLERISHLAMPTQVNRLALLRGSPYWADPERYGLKDIRPTLTSALVYQMDAASVLALEGWFLYRSDGFDDPAYQAALRQLGATMDALRARTNKEVLGYHRGEGSLVVTRSDARGRLSMEVITDRDEVALLESYEEVGTRNHIRRRLGLADADLDALMARLVERGLLLTDGHRFLTLPIPFDACAERDTGWEPSRELLPLAN